MKIFLGAAATRWLLLRSIKNIGHPESFSLKPSFWKNDFWCIWSYEFRKKVEENLSNAKLKDIRYVDWFNTSMAAQALAASYAKFLIWNKTNISLGSLLIFFVSAINLSCYEWIIFF